MKLFVRNDIFKIRTKKQFERLFGTRFHQFIRIFGKILINRFRVGIFDDLFEGRISNCHCSFCGDDLRNRYLESLTNQICQTCFMPTNIIVDEQQKYVETNEINENKSNAVVLCIHGLVNV